MFIHHCSVFLFSWGDQSIFHASAWIWNQLISLSGKLLNTTNAVACEKSRFFSPEEKRMFSQASCKFSFPPSPLAHAFSWGSLLSVSLLASFIVRMPMGQVLLPYSYFEKGCRIKCTRQPRKVLWAVLSHFFSKKFERMAEEAVDIYLRVLKESNKSRFDSYSVRNSVLNISHITFRDCRVHIFSNNLSRNSCIL